MPVTLYDIFECTECNVRARVTINNGTGMTFPVHCDQIMRMLDGFELNRWLKRRRPPVILSEEQLTGEVVPETAEEDAVA